MRCYRATVEATNGTGSAFKLEKTNGNAEYVECEDATVYLCAPDMKAAAAQLPTALKIEDVGKFLEREQQ